MVTFPFVLRVMPPLLSMSLCVLLCSTDDEIQEMIDEADRDQDGQINADEFYRVMKKR